VSGADQTEREDERSAGTAGARTVSAAIREPLRAHLRTRTGVRAPKGAGKASSVLIPLFERDGEVHLWLVRRAQGMRDHGGQVAFPGGKRDPSDDSLLTTALRETEEEVSLARAEIDVLGELDDYITITGFTITPYVGWVSASVAPRANEAEVARIFAAPLRVFLEAPTGIFPRMGYRVDGEWVWGATSAIARGLGAIVRELHGAAARPGT
jgi:8-oxo-dGTP pyrophosphatase MutT (NUDIX family)